MNNDIVKLVITSGEPAGIGPQISVQAAHDFLQTHKDVQIHLLGDEALFKPHFNSMLNQSNLHIEHVGLHSPNLIGHLNPKNAPYVLELLDHAYIGCHQQVYDAVVTAPIQKSVINESGIAFTGHTEYYSVQRPKLEEPDASSPLFLRKRIPETTYHYLDICCSERKTLHATECPISILDKKAQRTVALCRTFWLEATFNIHLCQNEWPSKHH